MGEGLLLKEHSRSARIFRPSLADLQDILDDIRGPLEAMAARRAAEHGGPALADELAAMLDHLSDAEPGLTYSSRHEAFHLRLTEANGSDRLTSLIRTLRAQSEPYVRLALQAADDFRQSASEQHWAIVQAIRARDGEDGRIRWSKRICVTRYHGCRGIRRCQQTIDRTGSPASVSSPLRP